VNLKREVTKHVSGEGGIETKTLKQDLKKEQEIQKEISGAFDTWKGGREDRKRRTIEDCLCQKLADFRNPKKRTVRPEGITSKCGVSGGSEKSSWTKWNYKERRVLRSANGETGREKTERTCRTRRSWIGVPRRKEKEEDL